jgi:hypothetical protein
VADRTLVDAVEQLQGVLLDIAGRVKEPKAEREKAAGMQRQMHKELNHGQPAARNAEATHFHDLLLRRYIDRQCAEDELGLRNREVARHAKTHDLVAHVECAEL